MFTGTEQWLLANDPQTLDFLNITIPIGDKPVPRNQLNPRRPVITNSNGVGKSKLIIFGVRLLR
jgi:hypothetical protein